MTSNQMMATKKTSSGFPLKKETIKQFFKFAAIGVINTGVDLLVLNVETTLTGLKEGTPYAIQKGVSFLIAVTLSYFMNKYWAFEDKKKTQEARKFSQFIFVSIIGAAINISVATLAVNLKYLIDLSFVTDIVPFVKDIDQLWVNIGALFGTAVGLFWNFIGYKFWVFKK